MPKVKLSTYNVHGWRDSDHLPNLDRICKDVNEMDPDVLVINEVLHPFSIDQPKEYWETVRAGNGKSYKVEMKNGSDTCLGVVAKQCGFKYISFAKAIDSGYFGQSVGYGNAILSKFPIVNEECVQISPDDSMDLGVRRIEAEGRSAVMVRIDVDGYPICIMATHLDQLDENLRTQQISTLLESFDNFEPYVTNNFLVGDLNTFEKQDFTTEMWKKLCDEWTSRGWSLPSETNSTLQTIRDNFQDMFYISKENSTASTKPPATCWSTKPLFRIDFMFCSKRTANSINVQKYNTKLDTLASDHFPVSCEFDIMEAGSSPRSVSIDECI